MNPRRARSSFGLAIAALLIVGLLGYFSLRPKAFLSIAKPFLLFTEVFRQIGKNLEDAFFGLTRIGSETAELREENNALMAMVATYERIKQENQVLHDALGRLGKEQPAIEGRVIGRSPTGTEDYIILDVGSFDGVPEQALVVARGDAYLGKVTERSGRTSKVTMMSDPGEKTEVFFPTSDVTSVAEGQGLGGIVIKVPASILLAPGDSIFYTGPHKDFYVGTIAEIEKSDEGAFQIVKTRIPFSVYDLRRVFILK